jgi:hypothetical protein
MGRARLLQKLSMELKAEERLNFRLLRGLEEAFDHFVGTYLQQNLVHKLHY